MDLQNLSYAGYGAVPEQQDYDFFSVPEFSSPPTNHYCSGGPGGGGKPLHDSIPIITKREEFIPDIEQSYTREYPWYNPQMASSPFAPDGSQALQLSQPPTPAAECQVSSTISPLNSPFTPRSDGSYGMFQPDGPTQYEMANQQQAHPQQEFASLAEFGEYKGMTEEQLVSLSARDLNRLCRDMPEDLVKQLKKRRRTLKNRGYAYNSRVRRVTQKNVLETERDDLKKQLNQLSERCKLLEREAEQWKRRCQSLQQAQTQSSSSDH